MAQSQGDTWWSRTIGDDNAATLLSFLKPPSADNNIPQTSGVTAPKMSITASPIFMPLVIGLGLLVLFLIVKKLK